MTDLVSIITPLHQSERFIEETILSIKRQSYSNWEMIIVDDCSCDKGVEIVQRFQKNDLRIKLLRNETKSGPALSRNKAIAFARGRYIAFLDSDDLWYPNKLEEQLLFMRANDYVFTYTAYDKITENGFPAGRINVLEEVTYKDLLKTCTIGCLTVVYDTNKLGKVYMPIIDKRQDFALWLKILKIVPIGYGLNKPLAKYRLRDNSVSSNKWRASRFQWKVYRDIENLPYLNSFYYFILYTFNGFVKTYFK